MKKVYKSRKYKMHLERDSCEPILNDLTGTTLEYLKNNSSVFNRYIKYIFKTSKNPYTITKSLCSQCVQTSNVMNYVFSDPEKDRYPIEIQPDITITRDMNTLISSFSNGVLYKDNITNPKELDDFVEEKANMLVTLFKDEEQGTNCVIRVPHSEMRYKGKIITAFAGHRFNIIVSPKTETKHRPIYVAQSSLGDYTLKIWVTNDFDDIKEFFKTYFYMIFNNSPEFTPSDIKLLKKVSGVPKPTGHNSINLLGIPKPTFISMTILTFTSESINERIFGLANIIQEKYEDYDELESRLTEGDAEERSKIFFKILKDSKDFYPTICDSIACEEASPKINKLLTVYKSYVQSGKKQGSFLNTFVNSNMDLIMSIIDYYIYDLNEFYKILLSYSGFDGSNDFIYFESDPRCKGSLPYATSASRISNCIQPAMQQRQSSRIKSYCRQSVFGAPLQTQSQIDIQKLKKKQKNARSIISTL